MIITCNSIREFIEEIDAQIKEHGILCVYQKTIRLSVDEVPLRDSESQSSRDVVRWKIVLQATTVLDLRDSGQYLLQAVEVCGIDYRDASNELGGTEELNKKKEMVKSFADHFSFRVGPGVIQV